MTNELAPALPESVAEIAEVIGREQALHLIGSLPQSGSRAWRICVYIPKKLQTVDHQLVRILGYNDAQKMVRAFSGMILQPSNCRFLVRAARNRRIREMAADGHSITEIAHGVALSAYRVREILSGDPPEAETERSAHRARKRRARR
ncbi:hypothetical protein [Pukyongiella litopenaei]|uniref:Mor transcription activator domain-containing protein n=1 Tax=Pukyongiella litopenaei TaxID=2605946 RepID=A0A2S0MNB5_9RHOB|nr:hypothetical protein [Pukyongiella litopenaei]AVO37379.1 hypothetical protein C6Y53_06420 [Pukyongiella litopenaei]